MNIFDILTLIGGLSLFLFGMSIMGQALERRAGGNLRQLLGRLTTNRAAGLLTGLGITAVIQSSSATTVMVVGFVNSGLMTLKQAINVIMGANVGTTVTAWFLSLSGIDSGSWYIRLLKPSSFTPVLALVGIIFYMFCRGGKKKDTGMILLGFATLMFGMETMSGAVSGLGDIPAFQRLFVMFRNPALGVLAGAILTAAIQSSSASVGILQALAVTGQVSYGAAIPIIMGQNIGTCVTALLSSVGTSRGARRAAIVHLYFNLIGTIVFMALFYLLHGAVAFDFMERAAQPYGIAVVHTVFNVFATCLLLPFSDLLEKLAYLTIKEDSVEHMAVRYIDEDVKALDSRFMNNPSLAMEQCRKVICHMADTVQESCREAIGLLERYTKEAAEGVRQLEKDVDRYEDVIGTYLLKLTGKDLSEKDSRALTLYLHCIGDFERISDHAAGIAMAYGKMEEKELTFSAKAQEELAVFSRAVLRMLAISEGIFQEENADSLYEAQALREVIGELGAQVRKRHVKRLRKGKCTVELGFLLADIVTAYERIAAHCAQIAVSVVQVWEEDSMEMHGYSIESREKRRDEEQFRTLYEGLRQEYVLP